MKKQRKSLEFQYDTLIDRQNFCNRTSEISAINQMISRHQKIVIYAPRRFGKTSLMRNIIAKDFLKKASNALVVSIDLMDVSNLTSIEQRLTQSISNAVRDHAPVRDFFEGVLRYFKHLALTFDIDPITGQPTASIKGQLGKEQKTIDHFFMAIKNIARDRPVLLIFDEFQDISYVPEAEAILRKSLQELSRVPTLISGSKRQLLNEMFASSRAPFFSFGDEITLGRISIEDWHRYFNERLESVDKKISLPILADICERVHHVPNAISEIGFWIQHDPLISKTMSIADVANSIDRLIRSKEQTYRYHLAPFSSKEKSIIEAIARAGFVQKPTAIDFLKHVASNASSVKKTLSKLARLGVVEWELNLGFRLSDPMLALFLIRNSAK